MNRLFELVVLLIMFSASACGSGAAVSGKNGQTNPARLTEEQKHRLYSAALAASDSPMDSQAYEDVCRTIGIFDQNGKPNDQYMKFVSQHVAWGTNSESDAFRREINSKEKAREYIEKHLSD